MHIFRKTALYNKELIKLNFSKRRHLLKNCSIMIAQRCYLLLIFMEPGTVCETMPHMLQKVPKIPRTSWPDVSSSPVHLYDTKPRINQTNRNIVSHAKKKSRKTIQNTPFQQHTIFSNTEMLWGGINVLFCK